MIFLLFVTCVSSLELTELVQDDPRLIEVLQNEYLVKPLEESVPYNFSIPGKTVKVEHSNAYKLANEHIFKNKVKNGFYIEAGAYNGHEHSNSLALEVKDKWNGLLVEAHPELFRDMKNLKRKAWLLGNCLATENKPHMVDFDANGAVGGIMHKGKRPAEWVDNKKFKMAGMVFDIPGGVDMIEYDRKQIEMLCFPLYSLLLALGNPTVHFFSLDVEGADLEVLKTIPFDKVDIKVINVEYCNIGNTFPGTAKDLDQLLRTNGYDFVGKVDQYDALYVKKGYLDEINEL